MQKVTPPNPKIWYCDNPAYLNNYPWFLCNIMGTFWYLRFCPFSDPLELQHLTFPKPQKLISSCLCLLEYTYKISLWSDEYFLSYRSELNFDVNCTADHALWPFDLKKLHLQALKHDNYICKPQCPSITGRPLKVRDRQTDNELVGAGHGSSLMQPLDRGSMAAKNNSL